MSVNPELNEDQKAGLTNARQKHSTMLTDVPGVVDCQTNSVRIPPGVVVNVRQYLSPFESQKVVEEEVRKMLGLAVIEPSTSSFASSVVLVKKKVS